MNEKKLNIVCYTVMIMFAVYTILYIILGCVNIKNEEKRLDSLYAYANKVNAQAEKENLLYKKDDAEEEEIKLLYTEETKLQAIVEGYNKTLNSNSFIADVNGTLQLDLPAGLSAKVKMRNFCVKYSQNKSFVEALNYVTECSSVISGTLKSRSQYGEKSKYENGVMQSLRSPNVTLSGDKMIANYTGYNYETIDRLSILNSLYIINEETIQDVSYFKIKTQNGKPYAYYIQATLDPQKSTTKYASYISEPIGSVPEFQSVKITIVLDTNGRMIAATSIDKFTASSEGFKFTATLTNNYSISCIGEEIIKEYD